MDDYIKEVSKKLNFDNNSLVKINSNLFLTKREIEVLERYNIDYQNCNDMNTLMYLIDEYLIDTFDCNDLENISIDISERNYYMNTNK